MVFQSDSQHIFVDVEVDLTDPENFLFAYIQDRETTGIFVRTTNPELPGTRLNVRLVSGARASTLEVDGLVTWVNPYRPGDNDNLSPGMAVRFLDLSKEQRTQLFALIKCIAYLDDDSPNSGPGDPVGPPLAQ